MSDTILGSLIQDQLLLAVAAYRRNQPPAERQLIEQRSWNR
jgi:hypothetical protein